RVFWCWDIGFFVDGRSNLREMCDRVFVLIGAIGFLGFWVDWAIPYGIATLHDFSGNGRSQTAKAV
ncbi:MAG: hypothetical protein ICV61_02655, partial [Microcoleus sp. Co-bin12]|nr:hypothetical protein [Microcoleus sp. Co-bin12]